MTSRYALPLWAKLYFVLMPLLIVGTSAAKADTVTLTDSSTLFVYALPFTYDPLPGGQFWNLCVVAEIDSCQWPPFDDNAPYSFIAEQGQTAIFQSPLTGIYLDVVGMPDPFNGQFEAASVYITTPEAPTWMLILPAGLLIGLKRLLWAK